MREIEYRAWDKKDKRMAQVLLIDWLNKLVDLDQGVIEREFEEVELLQYTGLKDEYENKLFEGDIVEVHRNSIKRYVIRFIDGSFVFATSYEVMCAYQDIYHFLDADYEVIKLGNIYENPGLLEGADE